MLQNIEKASNKIEELDAKMDINDLRLSIMAYEGNAAQSYWHQIRLLVTDETDFQNREHQGARDLTNMLLNYGYGILYVACGRRYSMRVCTPQYLFFMPRRRRNRRLFLTW